MPSTILPIDWRPIRHVVLDFGGVLYRINHRATAVAFHDLGFERFESLYDHGNQSGLMDDLECGIREGWGQEYGGMERPAIS